MLNKELFDKRLEEALSRTKLNIIGEEELKNISILECNEPLVNLNLLTGLVEVKLSEVRRNYVGKDELFAREGVFNRLQQIINYLPKEFGLRIFDAYRPFDYQAMRFNQKFNQIAKENPLWTPEQVRKETFVYVFPPCEDPKYPPAHSTGGAVDLTLLKDGKLLDAGCSYGNFDETCYTNTTLISKEQILNRKFLIETMLKHEFINYPGEWWHFMYGDREWAAYNKLPNALYGRADLVK